MRGVSVLVYKLIRNNIIMLDKKTWRNNSKFAISLEYENFLQVLHGFLYYTKMQKF